MELRKQRDQARGSRLAQAMEKAGHSVDSLALAIDVSARSVSRWRAGYAIKERYLRAICALLEISSQYLLTGQLDDSLIKMTDKNEYRPDVELSGDKGRQHEEQLVINHVPIHRLHIALIRHLRGLPEAELIPSIDNILNSRYASLPERYKSGSPVIDSVPLDTFEIYVILTLRSILSPSEQISVMNRAMSTRAAPIVAGDHDQSKSSPGE